MQVIIVGHHQRMEWVQKLQDNLPGAAAVVDFGNHGAMYSHIRALQIAATLDGRCVIMEDDAIPVIGFQQFADEWFNEFPDELISFYLGTGRPKEWQATVDRKLAECDGEWIKLPKLIHGVCYSLPVGGAQHVLARIKQMGTVFEGADFTIGRAWGRDVVYPVESLVEHRDGPCVEKHPDGEKRTEVRVARCLAGPLMYER